MIKEKKKINPPHTKLHLVKENYEIAWLTGTNYEYPMSELARSAAEVRQWIDDNCNYPVAFNTSKDADEKILYFYSEDDLMMFKLVWAGAE